MMKLQIKGKNYKIDLAKFDKIQDGIYLLRIEFGEPKYFECMSGVGLEDDKPIYSIYIFPRDREDIIDLTILPDNEFKLGEEYRIFCEGTRYILDTIFIRRDLIEKELKDVSIISL